jgi:hypothetical protein
MWLLTLLAIGSAQMPIDSQRLADTVASADLVIKQLRDYGDVAEIVRPVEAYFYGPPSAIARLEGDLTDLGWKLVDRAPTEDAQDGLTIARDQTTDHEALVHFSEDALRIEVDYGVEYDGWQSSVEKR